MPRKVNQNEKNDYVKKINEIVEASNDKFSNLQKFYGVNGQLNPEYVTDNPNNQKLVDNYKILRFAQGDV